MTHLSAAHGIGSDEVKAEDGHKHVRSLLTDQAACGLSFRLLLRVNLWNTTSATSWPENAPGVTVLPLRLKPR